MNLYLILQKTL